MTEPLLKRFETIELEGLAIYARLVKGEDKLRVHIKPPSGLPVVFIADEDVSSALKALERLRDELCSLITIVKSELEKQEA